MVQEQGVLRYRCRDGVEVRGAKGIQSSCRCSSAVVHRIRAGTEVVQWSKDGAEEMVHRWSRGGAGVQTICEGNTEQVQRCTSAQVHKCRGAEVKR